MSKFSPGPWRVGEIESGEFPYPPYSVKSPAVFDAKGEYVCETLNSMPGDARLIASAPEMLELLREANWSKDPDKDLIAEGWWARVAALLKRIEGEPPTTSEP